MVVFLVAALLEGRNFVGIEKNENVALFKKGDIDYIAVTKKRLRDAWNSMSQEVKESLKLLNLLKEF